MSYTISTRKNWSETQRELEHEFELWGIKEWETNYPKGARWEGYKWQSDDERMVTLRYVKNGREIKLAYKGQSRAVDNLRALFLTINDMRMTEVRGVSDLVESAYKQLGSGSNHFEGSLNMVSDNPLENPYEILGLRPDTSLDAAEAVYRTMARKYHPDSGVSASPEMFKRITEAIRFIREKMA